MVKVSTQQKLSEAPANAGSGKRETPNDNKSRHITINLFGES
jgi:hypothetical protein